MRVKETPIGEVRPYPGNPRVNDGAVEAVAASLEEFGWQQPIVVDADGTIVAGHTRYKAAKRLGMATVPVVVASGLTPEQVQAYRLADNKVGELAEWDMGLLAGELDGIRGIDMGLFGFEGGDGAGADAGGRLDGRYSQKVGKVDYEPSDRRWEPSQLFGRPRDYTGEIEAMDAPDGVKELCRLRNAWLCEFDYAKIADYYCNQATPEVQRMFERLALVLLDRDQLIENGFSELLAGIAGVCDE